MIGNYYSKLTCWNQSTDYNQMPPQFTLLEWCWSTARAIFSAVVEALFLGHVHTFDLCPMWLIDSQEVRLPLQPMQAKILTSGQMQQHNNTTSLLTDVLNNWTTMCDLQTAVYSAPTFSKSVDPEVFTLFFTDNWKPLAPLVSHLVRGSL